MAKKGVEIDLKESKKSVEQALRELKTAMEDDIERAKMKKYYIKPTSARRERKKVKRANIQRYNRNR